MLSYLVERSRRLKTVDLGPFLAYLSPPMLDVLSFEWRASNLRPVVEVSRLDVLLSELLLLLGLLMPLFLILALSLFVIGEPSLDLIELDLDVVI